MWSSHAVLHFRDSDQMGRRTSAQKILYLSREADQDQVCQAPRPGQHDINCQPPIVIAQPAGSSQIDDYATVQCQALGSISCAEHAVHQWELPAQHFHSFMRTININVAFEVCT